MALKANMDASLVPCRMIRGSVGSGIWGENGLCLDSRSRRKLVAMVKKPAGVAFSVLTPPDVNNQTLVKNKK